MLSALAWLRDRFLGNDTQQHGEMQGEIIEDSYFVDDQSDLTGTTSFSSLTHVWDRDPHAALQVIRIQKIQRILADHGLPPEIIRYIIRLAEEARVLSVTRAETKSYTDDANECYLRTPPLMSHLMQNFLMRISVDIDSHDQGWSNEPNRSWIGTYQGSYTWWEIALERQNQQGEYIEVAREHLTHNIHASREFRRHTLDLTLPDTLTSLAQPNDVLSLWARTQFAGWVNIVRYARISVWIDWDAIG
ncbi:hypothetical protein MPSI1_001629 [Malassezia psittaci]|uniref:Uncharacterized protein n=1 Tax=Malassezia psittaci TaxID=1821823 RepID=A0AAF0F561_9BASI|nr:hypothetical protein MPSI1_001629 [Malassezia psittaci]